MSASSGRDGLKNAELQSDLDAKGFAILNADLSQSLTPSFNAPDIEETTSVLKGDNAGNAVAAVEGTDFWGTDTFGPSGDDHAPGLVPDPGSTEASDAYLCEDGTWSVPVGAQAIPDIETTSGILKGDGAGNAVVAVAGVDYWDTDVMVASGASHAKGLVPDTPASSGTSKYLREDGTWVVPPAATGVTIASTSLVIKGDGAGGGIAATPGTATGDYVTPSTAIGRLVAATTVLSGSTPTVNFNLTTSFSQTLAANTTYTFSNETDGFDITIAITNTASNYTVTFPAGVQWSGNTQPTQTVGAKTDVWGFKRIGSVTYGAVVQDMS